MPRLHVWLAATIGCALLSVPGTASAASPYPPGSLGVDLSWPDCAVQVPASATFGIVGVTDGKDYSITNPCIAAQAAHFSEHLSLYANSGWDDQSPKLNASSPKACEAGNAECLAYNYGYNAGLAAHDAATAAGVVSDVWWLDVEVANTWNDDVNQNRNSLQGEYDALTSRGVLTVGVYSTNPYGQTITGSWHNGWPNWLATADAASSQGRQACTAYEFTGGPTLIVQFDPHRIDRDVAC